LKTLPVLPGKLGYSVTVPCPWQIPGLTQKTLADLPWLLAFEGYKPAHGHHNRLSLGGNLGCLN